MKPQKKAVIDIDNTLWHFCDVIYERLKKINSAMPTPDDWVEWDFRENYCCRRVLNKDLPQSQHILHMRMGTFTRS